MDFLKLLRRFIPPYKKEVALNVLFNLLSTLFSLFSFAAIIPVLQILFGITTEVGTTVAWDWGMSVGDIVSAWKNNLLVYIAGSVQSLGAGWMLFYIGLFLVVMTFLKTWAFC